MKDNDLVVGRCQGVVLTVDSLEAKANLMKDINEMMNRSYEIESNNYTCEDCVAYPCFRNRDGNSPAGLCFQEERRCRDECDNFIQDRNSGQSPNFQITGTCKKDNAIVNYEERCRFLD